MTEWTDADRAEMRNLTEMIAFNAAYEIPQDPAQLEKYREMVTRRQECVNDFLERRRYAS